LHGRSLGLTMSHRGDRSRGGRAMMLKTIWLVHPDRAMCDAFRLRFDGLPGVRVVRAGFEELEPHDCFVTAGNSFGIMTAGIDAAVVRFFGESLMGRVQHRIMDEYFGEQPVGTAFVIPTGHTEIPFLAHAPTMRVPGGIDGTDKVYNATWAALLAIHAHNRVADRPIEVAAFPAMGTGFGGMTPNEAARQMAAAYRHYLEPPHRLDWDFVVERQKAISYDGGKQVVR
jgi:O-acetyl-ADP-ribose deacetylase (regulator of RNase III)